VHTALVRPAQRAPDAKQPSGSCSGKDSVKVALVVSAGSRRGMVFGKMDKVAVVLDGMVVEGFLNALGVRGGWISRFVGWVGAKAACRLISRPRRRRPALRAFLRVIAIGYRR
jgi:hypothetical protein